jgi:hypothetical protein
MIKRETSGCESIQTLLHPTTSGVCWEICNVQKSSGDGQMTGCKVQNCEEKDAETKGEERRVELSLLVFNLGVQYYILSMDESMTI